MELEESDKLLQVKKNPFLNDEKTITVTHSSVDSTPIRYLKPKNVIKALNLGLFKTKKCPKNNSHNHKKCPYFHNHTDRRRPGGFYSSDLCLKLKRNGYCREGFNCRFSHNKVESLYHDECYKKRFCRILSEKSSKCDYGSYCAYAHNEEELRIEMIHNYTLDMDFYIFHFKTSFCPFIKCDNSVCVYAHSRDELRRKPHKIEYSKELSEKKNLKLKNKFEFSTNDSCNNKKEFLYHPINYKTKKCEKKNCDQSLRCPFFHSQRDSRQVDFKISGELMRYVPRNRILKNTFKFSEPVRPQNVLQVKQGNQQISNPNRIFKGNLMNDISSNTEPSGLKKKKKKKKLKLNPNSLEFSTTFQPEKNGTNRNQSLLNDLSSKQKPKPHLLDDLMSSNINLQNKGISKKNQLEKKIHLNNSSKSVEPKYHDKFLQGDNFLNLIKHNSVQTQIKSNLNYNDDMEQLNLRKHQSGNLGKIPRNQDQQSQIFTLFQAGENRSSSEQGLSNLNFLKQRHLFSLSKSQENKQQKIVQIENTNAFQTPKLLNKMNMNLSQKSNPDYNNKDNEIGHFMTDLELKKIASAQGYSDKGYQKGSKYNSAGMNIGVFNSFGLDRISLGRKEHEEVQETVDEDQSDEKIRDLVSKLIDD